MQTSHLVHVITTLVCGDERIDTYVVTCSDADFARELIFASCNLTLDQRMAVSGLLAPHGAAGADGEVRLIGSPEERPRGAPERTELKAA